MCIRDRDIAHYAAHALWPARRLAGREPNLVELHKMASGQWTMDHIVSHYSGGRGDSEEADGG